MEFLIGLIPLSYTDAVVTLGALLLGVTAGVLGTFAVLTRRSLVGDALAHATLPGVAIAFLITGSKDPATLIVGAAIAGLVGAMLMLAIERTPRVRPDSAIGVMLSAAFSLGIVLLTYVAARGNAQQAGLERYLFGQAAGLMERDVVVMAWLSAGAILCVLVGFRALKTATFDRQYAVSVGLADRLVEFASTALLVVAIVIGLRVVGAILMASLLIVPAVAARQFTDRLSRMLVLAGAFGAVIGISGSLLSARAALPTGPVIVLSGTVIVLGALMIAPNRGVLWRAIALRRSRRETEATALLVDLAELSDADRPTGFRELEEACAREPRALRRAVRRLTRAGLVTGGEEGIFLSAAGRDAAERERERRRLWSTWLEHGAQLDLGDAREANPRDLRSSLGEVAYRRLVALAQGDPR